jgi:hypothetical protein
MTGYDGHKRRKGSKVHAAVDTLGQLLGLQVTPANAQDRAQVAHLAAATQEATGEQVTLAFVDQGSTGPEPAAAAHGHGMELRLLKLPSAAGLCALAQARGGRAQVRVGRLRLSDAPPVHTTP